MRYHTCGKSFSRGVIHSTEKSLWVTSVSFKQKSFEHKPRKISFEKKKKGRSCCDLRRSPMLKLPRHLVSSQCGLRRLQTGGHPACVFMRSDL